MAKWLLILVLPLAALSLAGCVTEPSATLPMTLGPSDAAQASCLTYGDTLARGDGSAGRASHNVSGPGSRCSRGRESVIGRWPP
jgi:hypothetical protein